VRWQYSSTGAPFTRIIKQLAARDISNSPLPLGRTFTPARLAAPPAVAQNFGYTDMVPYGTPAFDQLRRESPNRHTLLIAQLTFTAIRRYNGNCWIVRW
jgi:hypothetical protein